VLSASAKAARGAHNDRPRWEVADVFRQHGEVYRKSHPLPPSHLKVMRAIESCRTAALGGHVEHCDSCSFERIAYNSCRNRHCPKCQSLQRAQWLEKHKRELLPTPYFHNVFTLPHELNPLARCNKKVVFDILFKSVAQTLQSFGRNPANGLGGKIGFLAVLHTWDQQLREHIHLHCLIPAGALSLDGARWIPARKNFLFSIDALREVFRGKYLHFLQKAFEKQELIFPGAIAHLKRPEAFASFIQQLRAKKWVLYSRRPFGSPENALGYLARYTYRVAIANHRIVNIQDGHVTFWYRDRRDGDKPKQLTLQAEEFIRRFLLHVLPPAFMRIRHFGLLANRRKNSDLARCRTLLGLPAELPKPARKTVPEHMLELTGDDVTLCPCCKKGHLRRVAELPKPDLQAAQAGSLPWDTS
jgi:hypothetical protein